MKTFIPEVALDRICTQMEPRRPDPATEIQEQDRIGNSAIIDALPVAPGDGYAGRTDAGVLHELEAIISGSPADSLGDPGLVLDPGWRADLQALVDATGGLTGERAILVEHEAGTSCGNIEDCRYVASQRVDYVREAFGRTALVLEQSLKERARTILGQGTAVTAMSGEFGSWAGKGAAALFSAGGSAAGGTVGGAIGGFVGAKVSSAVSRHVSAAGQRISKSHVLDDSTLTSFFTDYMLGWHLGVTESLIAYGTGDLDTFQAFSDMLEGLVRDRNRIVQSVHAHIMPPFLALGATTAISSDPFGQPTGLYDFKLVYADAGEGDAWPVQLAMPTAIGPDEAALLLDIPGLLTSQMFHLVSHDRRIQARVDVSGNVSRVNVDPTRRAHLQLLGAGHPSQVDHLRYSASQGDRDAQQQLTALEDAALQRIWDNIVSNAGPDRTLREIPNLTIIGAGAP